MDDVNNTKCYNCGKDFKHPAQYERHKNRKTPCLIREISPEKKLDPKRCIYCNKILSTIFNLNKHLKTCKIKNGGTDILVDKVVHEQRQKIRALEAKNEILEIKNKDLEDQLEDVWTRFDEVEVKISQQSPQQLTNITNNNTMNINIQIVQPRNYDDPCTEGLMPTPEELVQASGEKSLIFYNLKRIYFNADKPENHCAFVSNKKTKTLIVFKNGNWETHEGPNSRTAARVLLCAADRYSHRVAEHYGADNAVFDKLPGPAQTVIKEFTRATSNLPDGTRLEDIFSLDDVYDIALSGREIVRGNILANGCKSIRK
jgi:hypothetical protein